MTTSSETKSENISVPAPPHKAKWIRALTSIAAFALVFYYLY